MFEDIQVPLAAGFSRRSHGNMSLVYADTAGATQNRKRFLEGLGIDYRNLACGQQIHGSAVVFVTEKERGRGALAHQDAISACDALVTASKGIPIAVFTADCLSVFLLDKKTPSVAIVHAGRRSTAERILSKTIGLLRERFKTGPEDIHLYFGPAIGSCCYGVNAEFANSFKPHIIEHNGNYYLDLAAANRDQAREEGVPLENISDSCLCTSCLRQDFFSYRREAGNCGRMISVIMLKGRA